MNSTDRRAVERIMVAVWRQLDLAGPGARVVATFQFDRQGHLARSSGVQPAAMTLEDLVDEREDLG